MVFYVLCETMKWRNYENINNNTKVRGDGIKCTFNWHHISNKLGQKIKVEILHLFSKFNSYFYTISFTESKSKLVTRSIFSTFTSPRFLFYLILYTFFIFNIIKINIIYCI